MSSLTHLIPFFSIFLLLQPTTSTDILAPLFAPFFDELCKDIMCGKGACKTSLNYSLGYMCECDKGWKQSTSEDNNHFGFLPCVIPNCTVDYSCTKAESPVPKVQDPPKNISLFDPCHWAYCGEGSCMKASEFGYKCECREGHVNLFNTTTFPCFSECSIGADCTALGLAISNKTSPSTPTAALADDNHASSILPDKFLRLMILMMPIAMILWK